LILNLKASDIILSKKIIITVLLGAHLFCGAQLPNDIPTRGLQAYWAFSGNADDASGNKHHGIVFGPTLVKDRFGNSNSAYEFSGNQNLILTSYLGVLGKKSRCLSYWAKTSSKKNSAVVLWGDNKSYPQAGTRFDCSFNYKEQGVTVDIADAGITYEANSEIYDGEWHHYVFQFDTAILNKVEVYQDGNPLTHQAHLFYEKTAINTLSFHPVTFGGLYTIGNDSVPSNRYVNDYIKSFEPRFEMAQKTLNPKEVFKFKWDDYSYFFEGQLDDIAIYDRYLSHEEIMALYYAHNPDKSGLILKWVLYLIAILFLILLAVWLARQNTRRVLRREKKRNELQNKSYELENKVLMAQMNPHFIFNSLNAIQQFIIINDNEKAQEYLYKFSRLMRKMLETKIKDFISLEEEIDIIKRYLEIETLRFENIFNFTISVPEEKDISTIFIPHFLIQPLIENAIWHGLLPKKNGDKRIKIVFGILDEKTLSCTIEDNGVGRSAEPKTSASNKKSLAIAFIRQRLDLMSKINVNPYLLEIIDKTNNRGEKEGTKITITLPIINKKG